MYIKCQLIYYFLIILLVYSKVFIIIQFYKFIYFLLYLFILFIFNYLLVINLYIKSNIKRIIINQMNNLLIINKIWFN